MTKLKNAVKKIFPASKRDFAAAQQKLRGMEQRLKGLDERLRASEKHLHDTGARLERYAVAMERAQKELGAQKNSAERTLGISSEILWAQVFNSTISGSEWLTNKTFSPGRWAVGYPYLYVLYRVLDEMKPKRILELGLGQTTRMISQYAAAFGAAHDVAEHDADWISFFSRSFPLPAQTAITRLELTRRQYLEDDEVVAYGDFKAAFEGKKYDFLSIDGPFGYMAKTYARVDTLDILPGCLDARFVIMLDDYNRKGEQKTAEEIKKALSAGNIPFHTGVYRGEKHVCVIASEALRFLCSL